MLISSTQSVELNKRITASYVSKLKRYPRRWLDFCFGNPPAVEEAPAASVVEDRIKGGSG